MKRINLAVVGATGVVGQMMIKLIEEYNIPYKKIYLFASEKSAGKKVIVNGKEHTVILLNKDNIIKKKIDYALFSAGEAVSREFAPYFTQIGAKVIDNSSAFRMEPLVPLVVPEVNIKDATNCNIIANPNCSTIQCMPPLAILNDLYGLKRIDYTTFQAVSGSGRSGIEDLENSINGKECTFYPHPIFNNCLPHIGSFLDNNYSKEEIKMVKESQKILHLPDLEVSATCVRVPVFNSHSIEIDAEFNNVVNLDEIKNVLDNADGIQLLDDLQQNIYPLATLATGKDDILVGRFRVDLFNPKKLHFFCVADNIRKGAATNAVQILSSLIK